MRHSANHRRSGSTASATESQTIRFRARRDWLAPPTGGLRRAAPAARSLADEVTDDPELITALIGAPDPARPAAMEHEVFELIRDALARCPDRADLHYRAAEAAFHAGRIAESHHLVRAALRINPAFTAARILAARVLALRGEIDAALRHVEHALAAGVDYADVHTLHGQLLARRGAAGAARAAFERALRLNPALNAARSGLAALAGDATNGRSA
ncbi:MAG: tetratricopeptide repeat protein [Phycisphaerae bacterium]